MRTLLVTSEVTYVPGNYFSFFDEALKSAREHICGLVLLENASWKLSKDVLGLRLLGCSRISSNLLKNILELRKQQREELFRSYHLPVFRLKSMNSPEAIGLVRDFSIDLIANVRTRCIYNKEILTAPRLGCINIHHGLLPDYRGTLCDLYALSENRPAGFTIHEMNEKIDAGQILVRKEVSQSGDRDFAAYLEKTSRIEGQELGTLLRRIEQLGQLPEGIPNRSLKPVYTRNPNRSEIRKMIAQGMIL